jgi:hypothetical protein
VELEHAKSIPWSVFFDVGIPSARVFFVDTNASFDDERDNITVNNQLDLSFPGGLL